MSDFGLTMLMGVWSLAFSLSVYAAAARYTLRKRGRK